MKLSDTSCYLVARLQRSLLPILFTNSLRKMVVLMLSLVAQPLIGQNMNQYTFGTATGSFPSIRGTAGVVTPLAVSNGGMDDGNYTGITLPFTFTFAGVGYTTLTASTNGFIAPGQSLTGAYNVNSLASAAVPVIAPLWDDLLTPAGNFSYVVQGAAPYRVFVAEWDSVRWNYSYSVNGVISFQIRLYETSNQIDFVYRQDPNPGAPSGSAGASIGLSSGGAPVTFVSLSSSGSSPNISTSLETSTITAKPATGQIYSFYPGEMESNNTAGTANTIAYGDSIDALIASGSDIDYYKFYGTVGDTIEVLTYDISGSALDGRIQLYNGTGTLLADNDDYLTTQQSRIVYAVTAAGTFYIRYAYYSLGGTYPNKISPSTPGAITLAQGAASSGQTIQATYGAYRIRLKNGAKLTPSIVDGPWVLSTFGDSLNVYGHIFTNGLSTTVRFDYGTSLAYGSSVTASQSPITNGLPYAAFQSAYASAVLPSLTPNTTYHYRMVLTNSAGTTYSSDQTAITGPHPRISSISPTSGIVGSTLTINGSGFDVNVFNNIVSFGAVLGTVSGGNANQLTVIVPAGATYAPITVTAGGLAGCSSQSFAVSFPSDGIIDSTSFGSAVLFGTGAGTRYVAIADIDGDGKPDIVTYQDGSFSVLRNTSSKGTLDGSSFAPHVDIPLAGSGARVATVADVNGDGKPDLIAQTLTPPTVTIFRNRSTSGNIVFDPAAVLSAMSGPRGVAVGDLDGDGKPDLAVANFAAGTVSLFRNIGNPDSITASSFGARFDLTPCGSGPYDVRIADVDLDGKADLIVSSLSVDSMSVWRNIGTPGVLNGSTFAARVDFYFQGGAWQIAIGDFDNDGKPDIIGSGSNASVLGILKNLSSSGTISTGSLASDVTFAVPSSPYGLSLGDIDGDGNVDIVVGVSDSAHAISIYRNITTAGVINGTSLSAPSSIAGFSPVYVAVGDLDGDGKPDLVAADSNCVAVYRNRIPAALVTFQLDARNAMKWGRFTAQRDTLLLRGSVAPLSWFDVTNRLTDPNKDSIYTITIPFDSLPNLQYKFVIRHDGIDFWELDKGFNRNYSVVAGSQTLAAVSYNGLPSYQPMFGEYLRDTARTVALWHLNYDSTLAFANYSIRTNDQVLFDLSGNGDHGYSVHANSDAGRFEGSRFINGVASYVVVNDHPSLRLATGSTPGTVEAWVKFTGTGTQQVVGKSGSIGYSLWVANGKSRFLLKDSLSNQVDLGGRRTINDGKWHHIAGVLTGSQVGLYTDGVRDTLTSSSGLTGSLSTRDSLVFGGSLTYPYVGNLDEVRISKVARSPQEFNLQLPPLNLAANASGVLVALNWQNGGGAVGAAGYKLYRGLDSSSVSLVDSTFTTSIANTAPLGGTRFFYRVSAVDSLGFESVRSFATSIVTGSMVAKTESEPNDTATSANVSLKNRLAIGDTLNAAIRPIGDVDYFRLSVLASDTVEFFVRDIGNSTLSANVQVYDTLGRSVYTPGTTYLYTGSGAHLILPPQGIAQDFFLKVWFTNNSSTTFPTTANNGPLPRIAQAPIPLTPLSSLPDTGTYQIRFRRFAPSAPKMYAVWYQGATFNSATLFGYGYSNGSATTIQIQYGTSTAYGNIVQTPGSPYPATIGSVGENVTITGLLPNTTYHYRGIATNSFGADTTTDNTFTTPASPVGWALQSPPTTATIEAISMLSASRGFIAAENSSIYKTTNGGSSWLFASNAYTSVFGMAFTDTLNGVVAGYYGYVGRTTDGGSNWNTIPQATGQTLRHVRFSNANNGTVVGDSGIILRTVNGGATWAHQTIAATNRLNASFFSDSLRGTVVGNGGIILRTTNAGTNWTAQNSGTASDLYGIWFVDSANAIAVGGNVVLRTTDAGTTWTNVNSNLGYLRAVAFSDKKSGVAVGDAGNIFRTMDGGVTWIAQASGVGTTFYGVSVLSYNTVIAGGWLGLLVSAVDIPPAAPTSLVATPMPGKVALNWSKNVEYDLMRYRVYGDSVSNPTKKIDSLAIGSATPVDTIRNLNGSTRYFFRVTAVDSAGNESPYSNQVNAVPSAPPATPQNLVAIPGNGQILLKWNRISGASTIRYIIYRGTLRGPTTRVDSTTVSLTDTTRLQSGLTNGTTYFFRVTAQDTVTLNESPYSGEASAAPFRGAVAEAEPNNDTTHAMRVFSGDTLTASISSSADVDYYSFVASAGDTVEYFAKDAGSSTLEATVLYFDSAGNTMNSWGYVSQTTMAHIIQPIWATGRYYIKVFYSNNYTSFPNSKSPGLLPKLQSVNTHTSSTAAFDSGTYQLVFRRFVPSRPGFMWVAWNGGTFSDSTAVNAYVFPNGLNTTVSCIYGTTTAYGSSAILNADQLNGIYYYNIRGTLTGLTPNSLYHYRVVATNSAGADSTFDATFTTAPSSNAWSKKLLGPDNFYYAVWGLSYVDATTGTAVAGRDILRTTNGGSTWTIQTNPSGSYLYGTAFTDANNGLAVGESGAIIRTSNGGSTWQSVTSPTGNTLRKVQYLNSSTIVAVGYGGTILRSSDAGGTWAIQQSNTATNLFGVKFTNATTGYAVGDQGLMLKTTDAGASWTQLSSVSGSTLWDVQFTSSNTGYAVGYGIYRTTDAGTSWSLVGPNHWLYAVSFTDSVYGVAIGDAGAIYRTNDGGHSWIEVPSGTTNTLLSIRAVSYNSVYIGGDYGLVLKSLDIAPASPQNLAAAAGNAAVTLTWNKNTEYDFLRYRIFGSTSANASVQIDSTLTINDTTRIVNNSVGFPIVNGNTYYFRVAAVDSGFHQSGYSSEVSASPTAVQTISSISPTSGRIGSTVVISGNGFSTTASNNVVYFGGVRATVLTASSTSLSVLVPQGASYAPISLTVNGLTVSSKYSFDVQFSSSRAVTPGSFRTKQDIVTLNSPDGMNAADFQGDGRLEMAVVNVGSNSVSVFPNTTTSGAASFGTRLDLTTGTSPQGLAIGDIDGDGKLDIVTANVGANTISVFRNTSTVSTITFASKTDLATGNGPYTVAICDIDGDGKPDIITANNSANTISVLRNTSTPGVLSFDPKTDFATGASPVSVTTGDVSGDGRPDIIVVNNSGNTVSVLRNTSSIGTVSLAGGVTFATGASPYGVVVGDLDGDGKIDIAVTNNGGGANSVSILRNTTVSILTLQFAAKSDIAVGSTPYGLGLGDIDGDGLVDIVVADQGGNAVSVLKNNSVSGTISFASKVDFPTGIGPIAVKVADVDGDGRVDILTANSSASTVSFLKNVSPNTEVEPNDSVRVATLVALGDSLDAAISPNTDVDYYRVDVTANDTLEIALRATGSSQLYARFELYDSAGANYFTNYGYPSPSFEHKIFTVPNTGAYYVRVSYSSNYASYFPNSRIGNQRIQLQKSAVSTSSQTADTGTYRIQIKRYSPSVPDFYYEYLPSIYDNSVVFTSVFASNCQATTVGIDYGTTASYGSTVTDPNTYSQVYESNANVYVGGLVPNTTYHYRIRLTNASGTVLSGDQTFTTAATSNLWTRKDNGLSQNGPYMNEIVQIASNTTFALSGDVVYKSTDGGGTWTSQLAGVWGNSMAFANATVGVVIGWSGNNLSRTTDGGASWHTSAVLPTNNGLHMVRFVTSTVGFAVGESGTIVKTTDAGATWTSQVSGVRSALQGVNFIDANNGYVVGYDKTLLKTTDGGTTWTQVNTSLLNAYQYLAVRFQSSSTGYIACNGYVLKTVDGGTSWSETFLGTGYWLHDIYFYDANQGLVVGDYGQFLRTTDGGATWNAENAGTFNSANRISVLGRSTMVCGSGGLIVQYYSPLSEAEPNNTVAFANAMTIGDAINGAVSTAADTDYYKFAATFGDTVEAFVSPTGSSTLQASLWLIDSIGTKYAAGVASTPTTQHFVCPIPSARTYYLVIAGTGSNNIGAYQLRLHRFSPSIPDIAPGWLYPASIFSNAAALLSSVYPNGSPTTISYEIGTTVSYGTIVNMPGTLTGIGQRFPVVPVTNLTANTVYHYRVNATNAYGTISGPDVTFNTPLPSDSWMRQASGTTERLNQTVFVTTSAGTAVGLNGTILHTLDKGQTWQAQTSPVSRHLFGISTVSSSVGVVVGDSGTILKTINSGTTWLAQASQTVNGLRAVDFINANVGFAVGLNGTIDATTNGGSAWSLQASNTTATLTGVSVIDASTAYVVGFSGTILKTTNGGLNWAVLPSPTPRNLMGVWFFDANTGVIIGGGGTIKRTTDGGVTWSTISTNTANDLNSITFADGNNGTIVGDGGTILRSTNAGTTWVSQQSGTTNQIMGVSFAQADTGTVVGQFGTILRFVRQTQPPAVPTLAYPANSVTAQPLTDTLRWNSVRGAMTYWLQVSSDANFNPANSFVVNDTTIVDTSRIITRLNYATIYYWRVGAENSVGSSAFSSVRQFTTMAMPLPASVTLAYPVDGSTNLPTSPRLQWNSAAFAQQYQVQVASNSGFTTLVTDSTLADTSLVLGVALENNKTFYWRVISRNSTGSDTSSMFSFTTTTSTVVAVTNAASSVTSSSAILNASVNPNGTSTTAYFQWGSSSNYTDSTASRSLGSGNTSVVVTDTLRLLANGATYHFRIVAINPGNGARVNGSDRTFTTGLLPPSTPANLSATLNSQVSTIVTLSWSDVSNEDGYSVYRRISTEASFNLLKQVGPNVTSYTDSTLSANAIHYYRVTAFNAAGNSTNSDSVRVLAQLAPLATLSVSSANFGSREITFETFDSTIVLSNTGSLALNVYYITLVGHDSLQYVIQSGGDSFFSINPGQKWNIVVRFAPTAVGTKTAQLQVKCNDNTIGTAGTVNIPLSGVGLDTRAPSAPISAGVTPIGWSNSSTFTVTWLGPSDASGVAALWYNYDTPPSTANFGTRVAASTGGASGQASIAAPQSSGVHTVYLYLEDGNGNKNVSSVSSIGIRYDNTAPTITHNASSVGRVTVVGTAVTSGALTITASASKTTALSGVAPASFVLQYKHSGDVSFTSTVFNTLTNGTAQIPSNYFVANGQPVGVEYKVSATDSAGNTGTTATYSVAIDVQSAPVSTFVPPAANTSLAPDQIVTSYRMVSVPYNLADRKPSTIVSLSNFGSHQDQGVNYANWRMQKVTGGGATVTDYEDFKDEQFFVPGAAAFLIMKTPKAISVGSGSIVRVDSINLSGIQLGTGWNLLGNPFQFNVPIDSLKVTGGTVDHTAYFSGSGGTSGWDYDNASGKTLRTWEGLAVHTTGTPVVRFETPQVPLPGIKQFSRPDIARSVVDSLGSDDSWIMQFDAVRMDNGMKQRSTMIGMVRGAREGRDDYDWPLPPVVGSRNVAVYFKNPDDVFIRDIRPVNTEGEVWDMRVVTGDRAAKISLKFSEMPKFNNPDFRSFLIDLDEKMAYDLKDRSSIEINSKEGIRNLRIVVGTKAYVEQNSGGVDLLPKHMTLYQNYPNPFNPETVIRYTVPDAKPTYRVTLKVYNILGQEVATVVDADVKSGYYEATFSGKGMSSGTYIYRILVTGGSNNQSYSSVKKMLLVK